MESTRRGIRPNGKDITISVIGAGNMGRAIVRRLVAGGHTVYLADTDAEKLKSVASEVAALGSGLVTPVTTSDAAVQGEIVVLATRYNVSTRVAVEFSDVLRGKIVIDISNPLNDTFDDLVTDPTTSASEEIQRRLKGAFVVKAFNTTFAPVLFAGQLDGVDLDVFLASDHAEAKAQVDALLRPCGLRPIDAGALKNARTLERITLLWIELQGRYGLEFQATLKFLPLQLGPVAVQKTPAVVVNGGAPTSDLQAQVDALKATVAGLDARLESMSAAFRRVAELAR
jgi:8-hydroxy-5-deazaflavin:NADPH oxidoreductase